MLCYISTDVKWRLAIFVHCPNHCWLLKITFSEQYTEINKHFLSKNNNEWHTEINNFHVSIFLSVTIYIYMHTFDLLINVPSLINDLDIYFYFAYRNLWEMFKSFFTSYFVQSHAVKKLSQSWCFFELIANPRYGKICWISPPL